MFVDDILGDTVSKLNFVKKIFKKFSNFCFFLKIEKTIFLSEISTSIFSSVHHLLKTHQMTLKPQFYFSPDPGEHSRYFDHGQKVKIHQNMTKGSFWIKGASECTAMRTPFNGPFMGNIFGMV